MTRAATAGSNAPARTIAALDRDVGTFLADVAGELIHYTITVQNTGNTTLTGVVVTDPNADPGTIILIIDAASADIAAPAADADPDGLEIRIPVGGAAVDRLDKWVEGTSLPWRLALAREAARRGGGDLQVDVEDGQIIHLPGIFMWPDLPNLYKTDIDQVRSSMEESFWKAAYSEGESMPLEQAVALAVQILRGSGKSNFK